MFRKCDSILQFNDRDCVQRVIKINLDYFINGSRRPQLKTGLCGTTKTVYNCRSYGSQEIKYQLPELGVKTRR